MSSYFFRTNAEFANSADISGDSFAQMAVTLIKDGSAVERAQIYALLAIAEAVDVSSRGLGKTITEAF